MAKKIVVGIAGATLLGLLLFGTRFFGYVGTVVDNARTAAQDAVPFEMKIQEAKKKVASLDSVIEKHMKQMAETKADINQLGDQIVQAEKNLDVQIAELGKLRQLEKTADTEYVSVNTTSGPKKYTVSQLGNEIDRRTGTFKRGQKGLELKQAGLEKSQKKYAELEERFNQLVSVKEEMELRIKELEAKKAELDTRRAAEATEYDDSDVKEAQEILDELNRSLNVQSEMLDLKTSTGQGHIEIDLDAEEEHSRDELDQILKKSDVKPASELISIES